MIRTYICIEPCKAQSYTSRLIWIGVSPVSDDFHVGGLILESYRVCLHNEPFRYNSSETKEVHHIILYILIYEVPSALSIKHFA